uniref:rRNA N-glycosidase n=1 Tax=Oryza nivara TaxID=4536 RepID=A0A0E0IYN2_ORYNI
MAVRVENVEFNVRTGNYPEFMNNLRDRLAEHPDLDDVYAGCPVLAMQRCPKQPARWMYINLVGNGDDRATLAVRDDNVNLIGFRNLKGQWFHMGFSGMSKPILPEPSTFLGCDGSYPSLLGGRDEDDVKNMLVNDIDLRQVVLLDAVHKLSGYEQPPDPYGAADDDTKLDLVHLTVVFCEGARMALHYDAVNDGQISLNERQVDYLRNWWLMSRALLQDETTPWPRRLSSETGINDDEQARRVVLLVLNTSTTVHVHGAAERRRSDWLYFRTDPEAAAAGAGQTGHGGRFVEVLAATAGFGSCTIAVFDGKRGQILYRPHHQRHYTNYQNEYNKTLTHTIGTTRGPVDVTYAVLSDAVEATVQLKLLLPVAGDDNTDHHHHLAVYGDITARSHCLAVGSALFRRGSREDAVALAVAAGGGSAVVDVPLQRCVVAVPLDWPLEIDVQLYVVGEEGIRYTCFQRLLLSSPGGEQQPQRVFHSGNTSLEVNITWSRDF